MIVTVTGLKVKAFWYWPAFWRHAIPSFSQCRASDGCLFAETFSDGGFKHTLTVFETRQQLKAFALSGAHRKAAKAFRRIATGKILSWENEELPSRSAALAIWHDRAEWY